MSKFNVIQWTVGSRDPIQGRAQSTRKVHNKDPMSAAKAQALADKLNEEQLTKGDDPLKGLLSYTVEKVSGKLMDVLPRRVSS